jgi:hypothetical protein
MTDGPIPGKVRMIGGKEYRFIEHALEVDKWEAVASPIPAAPSDVAGLVERLKRLRSIPSNPLARSGFGQRVNPDGPEAAALIESLAHDREMMREAFAKTFSDVVALRKDHPGQTERFYAEEATSLCRRGLAALASLKGGEK